MAEHLKTEKRVVGGYSLKGINKAWLKRKAAEAMLAGEGSVSASTILDRLLDAARAKEETPPPAPSPSRRDGEGGTDGSDGK